MVSFVIDMNLAPRWASYLTNHGYNAEYWADIGAPDASDSEIVAYARTNNKVIITNDLDFGCILAITGGKKPSVIQIRANDIRPEIIGKQVVGALKQTEKELKTGALITVLPQRTRIRVLPLSGGDS